MSSDASIDKELPNSNFSESNKLVISQNGNKNSLLQINIKSIVKNTQLDSAFLYLYVYKEFKILEDDFLEIEPITENWKAEDVNWNTKPETDSTRKIQVKLKRNNLNCYRINVTNFVEEITSGNQKNMGL
ncbi:MAG: DNRLRE domain-containing protein, partial [Flavobacteriaceae bacterium]